MLLLWASLAVSRGLALGTAQKTKLDKTALWKVLEPYAQEGYVSKAGLKSALAEKDKYGQPLALPPKHVLLSEVDVDHDGRLSKEEVQTWQGYGGKAYCRNLGDASYGCIPRCSLGTDVFDGNSGYFTEKYEKNVLNVGNTSAGQTFRKSSRFYRGEWSVAQNVAIEHLLRSVLRKNVNGAVVHMGLKDVNSWRHLRQTMQEVNEPFPRDLYLYDNFEGLPECNHEFDTGMCPPPGAEKASFDGVTAEVQRMKKERVLVPEVMKFDFQAIPGNSLPMKVAFAVLDPVLYQWTEAMLHKIGPRLSVGGKILVHDFGWEGYTGIEKAVDNFLSEHRGFKARLPSGPDGVACYLVEITKVTG